MVDSSVDGIEVGMSTCSIAPRACSDTENVSKKMSVNGMWNPHVQARSIEHGYEGRQHLVNCGGMKEPANVLSDIPHVP